MLATLNAPPSTLVASPLERFQPTPMTVLAKPLLTFSMPARIALASPLAVLAVPAMAALISPLALFPAPKAMAVGEQVALSPGPLVPWSLGAPVGLPSGSTHGGAAKAVVAAQDSSRASALASGRWMGR